MKVKSLSCVQLLATRGTAAYQAPPSMGFSRQEYWSGVPLPSPVKRTYWYINTPHSFGENYNTIMFSAFTLIISDKHRVFLYILIFLEILIIFSTRSSCNSFAFILYKFYIKLSFILFI